MKAKLFVTVLFLAKLLWPNNEHDLSHKIELSSRGRKLSTVPEVGLGKLDATPMINTEKSLPLSSYRF